jgi:hypothetical protein
MRHFDSDESGCMLLQVRRFSFFKFSSIIAPLLPSPDLGLPFRIPVWGFAFIEGAGHASGSSFKNSALIFKEGQLNMFKNHSNYGILLKKQFFTIFSL